MFTNARGFNNNQLVRIAPSIGATEAHNSRTSKYEFVSTLATVDGLRDAGFTPTGVMEARTRDVGKRGFTKHMLVFTREQDLPKLQRRVVGDLFLQIYLTNSHAGESSWCVDRGVYRLACDNGLMVGGGKDLCIRLRHTGTIVEEVVEAMREIASGSDRIMERIEDMQRVRLSQQERLAFGRAALALRWPEIVEADPGSGALDIPTPQQIVTPIREADRGDTVFKTFNVAQEKLVNGHVPVFNERGHIIKRTRAINNIVGLTTLNKNLWTLAESFV